MPAYYASIMLAYLTEAYPATAGPKFPVHQESLQLIKQLRNFILQLHVYTKAIALLAT